ncbi:hypothetical protein [Alteraurantiacibacter buctensis]|uniref:Uncharacterized protein n=1 Tax=Alteraurantiacibacter buctensis TaxID=1503981 RepID=A0A844YWL3_9SPHN|nr:hypothetical protein [Alteraurantiacibacter buctensis]MXO70864.1 hypothetical protein [Alteraurantiacibacter buctensis]
MMTFLAFHGDELLRLAALERLAQAGEGTALERLAGPGADLPAAHAATGFPLPLMLLVAAIHAGLEADEGQAFLVRLVEAAEVHGDMAEVADAFLQRQLLQALGEHGVKRLRGAFPVLAGMPVDDHWPVRATDRLQRRAGEGVRLLAALGANPAAEMHRMAGDLVEQVRAA